jgi:hypothetical protein
MATYNVPGTIDHTGATDVSTALATFIASVPDYSTVVFVAGGTYKGHIRITSRNHLYFDGNGATLHCPGYATDVVNVNGSSYITWHNITLTSDNANAGGPNAYGVGEYSAGIWIKGSNNIEIDAVHIASTYGDSIYIGSYPNYVNWCDTVWIHGCTLELNGRCGLVCDAGRNVIVENNTINTSAMHVFDIEPFGSGEGASNVIFRNNTVGTYGHTSTYDSLFFCATGVRDSTLSGITVTGNTVQGNNEGYLGKAVGLSTLVQYKDGTATPIRRLNVTFTNNVCTRPINATTWPTGGIQFNHVDGLTVFGNTQPVSAGTLLLYSDCTNVVLTGNQASALTAAAIAMSPMSVTAKVASTPRLSSGAGVAFDATVSTSAPVFTYAAAGVSSGTGAVPQAVANVGPKAECPGGIGEAFSVTSGVAPTEGVATGTGTGIGPTAKVALGAGYASATGVARNIDTLNMPVFVSPPNGAVIGTRPSYVFTMPASRGHPMFFHMEVSSSPDFTNAGGYLSQFVEAPDDFEFWNGSAWVTPDPALDGVPAIYGGNQARFNMKDVTEGVRYRRIRVGF